MAPTVRSSAIYGSTNTEASSTVSLPTGWQIGDVCYIGYELTASTGTVTTPAGWTAVVAGFRSAGTTNCLHGVLRRVLQAGDTAPAISHTAGRFAAISAAVQDADTTTPEDVTPTTDDNSGVTSPSVRAPSITPVTANCLLLTWHALRNGTNDVVTSFTPDASETEVNDASSNTSPNLLSGAAIELASLALGAASATGTKTATATGTNVSAINPMGAAIAVRPAAATSIAPDGISVPVTLGSPTVSDGSLAIAPNGISAPVTLGSPTVTWSGSIAPDGISVPVALGSPTVGAASLAPDGIAVPVTLGSPTLTWSGAISPAGIAVPVTLGAPTLEREGAVGAEARITASTPRGRTVSVTPRRIVHTTPRGRQ